MRQGGVDMNLFVLFMTQQTSLLEWVSLKSKQAGTMSLPVLIENLVFYPKLQ